ncbi:MAG: DUF2461 domain-containing protein [Tannerellaceae bacterium]|jgi:uncharacterized protein (TIGR02453 family)|nr:DUF2461 domain-containing protein [Tannerellaceae bacterium]
MVIAILDFLRELERNNNREWFQINKSRYDILQKAYTDIVQQLINRIGLFDVEVSNVDVKDCLFRIYRDVRFSPNKAPYKTHMGAYIAARGGRRSIRSGYYFHLEPGSCFLSGGLWMPEVKLLRRLRRDIFNHIDEFMAIVDDPAFKAVFPGLEGSCLKRMPEGFPADFKHGEIIRHKDFCVSCAKSDSFFARKDWLSEAASCYEKLLPFNNFLNYTVDEYRESIFD